jgi:hypothetical protein
VFKIKISTVHDLELRKRNNQTTIQILNYLIFKNEKNLSSKTWLFKLKIDNVGWFKMIVAKCGNHVRKFMWQLCGWGRVDICMTFHKRAFDFFIPLHIDLTIFKIAQLWTVKEMSTLSHPHKLSYTAATPIHNHFESPNIINL